MLVALLALLLPGLAFPVLVSAKGNRAGTWTKAPNLLNQRIAHAATLLPDGRVLVTGGWNVAGDATATAELFDPKINRWLPAASMSTVRAAHTATLLSDGTVLVAGGEAANNTFPNGVTATAEIYHPSSNRWTPAASMHFPRSRHSAVRLHDGRVLLVGGFIEPSGGDAMPELALEQAELYDPKGNSWRAAGDGLSFVSDQALTLLSTGQALVTGGASDGVSATSQAEFFDPATNRWRPTTWPMATPRYGHTATLLANGMVFLTGGYTTSQTVGGAGDVLPTRQFLNTSEIFDLRGNSLVRVAYSDIPRFEHTATLLDNGAVLVVGSAYASNADSQLFDPANTENWISTGVPMDRYLHTATRLVDGRVLIAGGYGVGSANTAWLFSAQSVVSSTSYSPSTGLLIAAFVALALVAGMILVATRRPQRRAARETDSEWIGP